MGDKIQKQRREMLKALRATMGLTQTELGTLMGFGTPQKAISNLERGVTPIEGRHVAILSLLSKEVVR